MNNLKEVSCSKSFDGLQKIFSHHSKELSCDMKFSIYLPPGADKQNPIPVLYWLSGLTCSEENFIQKAGAQRYAAKYGLCIVCPDTSPRQVNLPGEDESYDFGSGAGFYVDATEEPWKKHYRMFSYVTNELIKLVESNFPIIPDKRGISGHSMGGHGALICALKNSGLYKSVSAIAPIANPMQAPWGQKAFTGYLGSDKTKWEKYDATELAKNYDGVPIEILIDQGNEDNFYKQKQLLPENLIKNSANNDRIQAILKMREGYDHSYFYVASIIGEHIEYHSKLLNA